MRKPSDFSEFQAWHQSFENGDSTTHQAQKLRIAFPCYQSDAGGQLALVLSHVSGVEDLSLDSGPVIHKDDPNNAVLTIVTGPEHSLETREAIFQHMRTLRAFHQVIRTEDDIDHGMGVVTCGATHDRNLRFVRLDNRMEKTVTRLKFNPRKMQQDLIIDELQIQHRDVPLFLGFLKRGNARVVKLTTPNQVQKKSKYFGILSSQAQELETCFDDVSPDQFRILVCLRKIIAKGPVPTWLFDELRQSLEHLVVAHIEWATRRFASAVLFDERLLSCLAGRLHIKLLSIGSRPSRDNRLLPRFCELLDKLLPSQFELAAAHDTALHSNSTRLAEWLQSQPLPICEIHVARHKTFWVRWYLLRMSAQRVGNLLMTPGAVFWYEEKRILVQREPKDEVGQA